MAVECGVITILLLFLIGAFLRTRRNKWALATLPLLSVPATHMASIFIMGTVLGLEITLAMAAIPVIIALVAGCTWIGFYCAIQLQKKKSRITYLSVTIGFNIILSLILIGSYYIAV